MRRDHDFSDYRERRVTVMGLGNFGGGLGAVKFLAERGATVCVTDTRSPDELSNTLNELQSVPVARWRLGEHCEDDFVNAELVVVNPAVPRDHPLLQRCRDRGIPLTSEMNLFVQHQRGTLVGVTGSNGKSTTTALLYNILRHTSRRCWLGGNLGRSLLSSVDEISPDDLVVLELSSFQLEDLDRLAVSPHVAVVTNFSPNHLDWHGTLEDYRLAKQSIVRWQSDTDVVILNGDDPDVATWTTAGRILHFGLSKTGTEGVFACDEDTCLWRKDGSDQKLPVLQWLRLPGRHNLCNALAASAAALSLGADVDAVRLGLETFEPLPHRLQFLGTAGGRMFYNDSLATTPESTLVALEAFTQPIVLIAGGYDKRVDLTQMANGIVERTKAVALIGQTAERLRELIVKHTRCTSLPEQPLSNFSSAFDWAIAHSSPGDVILLSPGCASFDWFRNFADRGAQFAQLYEQWACRNPAVEGP